MKAAQVTLFECPGCLNWHESHYEAAHCCEPDIEEVTHWQCGDCGGIYKDQEDARLCCWDGETELEPYIITPAELEAAGQQRLAL